MFQKKRQVRLNPLLKKLEIIPGFKVVWQDDFDSAGINVMIRLDDANSRAGSFDGRKPLRFAEALGTRPVAVAKNAIKKICKELNIGFNFLDWPKMQYKNLGKVFGKTSITKDGYDTDLIKIEVYV
jgi:hypothetical protein